MRKARSLTGMPVVCEGRRIGRVLRADISPDLGRMDGIWVGAGVRGARYIPAERLELIGEVAVHADGGSVKRRMTGAPLPMRAVSTDGHRLGAVTDVEVDALSFQVAALELSRGVFDDLIIPRRRVTRYAVNGDKGEVVIDPASDDKEAISDEERNDEGIFDGHADRRLGGDDLRRAELADGEEVEPEGQADGQLDQRQGGRACEEDVRCGWAGFLNWKLAGVAIAAGLGLIFLWRPLLQVGLLALGAAALCFLLAPLAGVFEKRLPRPAASLACLICAALAVAGLLWLLLPAVVREVSELARTLPGSLTAASNWLSGARGWLEGRLPGISLPKLDLSALQGAVAGLASGTINLAANVAEVAGRASMTIVLSYFFLRDRDALLLRLELLIPCRARSMAVEMGGAACREIRLYLQGQLMIAGAVALMSIAALMIVGVRSAVVLGLLIGILNMIPYFGPFIGGVPAVLIALTDGWQKAAVTVAALAIVQQLDGSWISPRVLGSLTGFSPALVLAAIYGGARLGGVAGMLVALPSMMTARTLFRVFVQKCENI